MFKKLVALIRRASADEAVLPRNPRLVPIGRTARLDLPIWLNERPDAPLPKTYADVFWEIEPTGEYLFYLAGDYLKTEAGLLRYPTAPVTLLAERTFEKDTIQVALSDGRIRQAQARAAGMDAEGLAGLTVAAACQHLLGAQCTFRIALFGDEADAGRAWLEFEWHPVTGAPCLRIVEERYYPASAALPKASLMSVNAFSRDAEMRIDALLDLHEDVAALYRQMPAVPLSGAERF